MARLQPQSPSLFGSVCTILALVIVIIISLFLVYLYLWLLPLLVVVWVMGWAAESKKKTR